MANVRVLVVDDSAAMRALFCDILDNAKGVTVCGTAKNADEARDQIAKLNPDVLTLDVEMPGKSGIELLEEIMTTDPMPVIMLSTITQNGTGTARRALDLGAVHCFPKPLHTSRDEFNATVSKLGDIVLRAASGELKPGGDSAEGQYASDGRIVALTCGSAGMETARQVMAAYDSACPPTIIVFDAEPDSVNAAVRSMRNALEYQIEDAVDGGALEPGKVWLAFNPTRHVIVEPGEPPRLRLIERDPVNGCRPSADLLFGSLARGGLPTLGGVFNGTGTDGAKGLQILAQTNGKVLVQSPAEYAPRDRYEAVRATGITVEELNQEELPAWILAETNAA